MSDLIVYRLRAPLAISHEHRDEAADYIARLQQELAEARAEITRGIEEEQRLMTRIHQECSRAEAAESDAKCIRAALEPFAKEAEKLVGESDELWVSVRLNDLRRALASCDGEAQGNE